MAACTHLDLIEFRDVPEDIPGCEDCLKIDGWWVHLRRCAVCGHVACCDNSPNRHASVHAAEAEHPVMRSVEPYENWFWCYVDEVAIMASDVGA